MLVPWPNRTAGGRWSWQGTPHQLALNEPAAGNAIHGLLRYTFYEVVERAADTITLAARVAPQPGWPVPLATQVRYAVAADGLTVTHTVTQRRRGRRAVRRRRPPLRPGRRHRHRRLHAAARRHHGAPAAGRPAHRPGPAREGDTDFRDGRPLKGVTLDDAFGGCVPAAGDELVRHRLLGPDGGVEVWAEPAFGWVQVFTPATTPAAAGRSPSSR